jgi:hypothetical protein
MIRRLMLGLAPAALAFAAVAAHAQPPAGPGPGHPMMAMHGRPSPEMKAMHEAMMKQHIEDLKTVLRLRPDQEAALQAFVAAHHPPEGMDKMHDGPMQPPKALTTPERLDEMAKHEAEMRAEHETMRQALSKFYASLSPDQQKVFDALQRLQGPHGGGHMMMMGGPGMRRLMIHHGPMDVPMPPPMPGDEPD